MVGRDISRERWAIMLARISKCLGLLVNGGAGSLGNHIGVGVSMDDGFARVDKE